MIALSEGESLARDPIQARLANRFSHRSRPQERPVFVYFASTSDGRNLPHVSGVSQRYGLTSCIAGPPAPEHLPQQSAVPKRINRPGA
jgi:hypothetical protein